MTCFGSRLFANGRAPQQNAGTLGGSPRRSGVQVKATEQRVDSKRFALATLTGIIAVAVVGGLLYGVVFADLFAANQGPATGVMRNSPGFGWIALAHVPFGLLLTLVISWRGEKSARGGAITGAILGFLMAAGYDLSQYGTTHLWTLKLTLVEPFITMLMVGAAGAAVGAVLGMGSPNTSAE